MIFSDSLELAIGLTFIFLIFSLTMSTLVEGMEAIFKNRRKFLLRGIINLLEDPDNKDSGKKAAESIYYHPLIYGLFQGNLTIDSNTKEGHPPSYIPSYNFSLALIDHVLDAKIDADTSTGASIPRYANFSDRLRLAAERTQNKNIRRAIIQAINVGGEDSEKIRNYIETWYNSAMDRTSGMYKRHTQKRIFIYSAILAILLNINTISISESLSKNATIRRAITEQSYKEIQENNIYEVLRDIDRLGLPIGWSKSAWDALILPTKNSTLLGIVQIIFGYILTALAPLVGAPFWFDTLNKIMVIRATVKPHEKSPEESSKDRSDNRNTVSEPEISNAPSPSPSTSAIDSEIYAALPLDSDRIFEDEDTEDTQFA